VPLCCLKHPVCAAGKHGDSSNIEQTSVAHLTTCTLADTFPVMASNGRITKMSFKQDLDRARNTPDEQSRILLAVMNKMYKMYLDERRETARLRVELDATREELSVEKDENDKLRRRIGDLWIEYHTKTD
jgi:hypothetical protein